MRPHHTISASTRRARSRRAIKLRSGVSHSASPPHPPERTQTMPIKTFRRALRKRLGPIFVSTHDQLYPCPSNRFTLLLDSASGRRVDANSWIADKLTTGEPFCVARFGADEYELAQDWRRRTTRTKLGHFMETLASGKPLYSLVRARTRMKKRGFHPLTPLIQERFHDAMVESMRHIDLLGSWIIGETWFGPHLERASVCPIGELEPYRSKSPWSAQLESPWV